MRALLRLLQPEEFDQAMDCQRRFAARNHGMVEKFDEELRGARGDIQVRRMGYYDGGRLLGYAAYRFESASACNYTQNRLSVEELVYENGTVLRALLGGLRMQEDLAQTVILRTGEEDFHHLLDDPQDVSGNYIDYGFLQTNVSAVGTMFKLTDGADFVRRTGYRNFPAGTLTAAGRAVLAKGEALAADAAGRYGDLSPRGVREHRAIAERMYAAYPEVFSTADGRECRVESRSTLVPRCILSMAAFNERLKELNPAIRTTRESSARYMPYMGNNKGLDAQRDRTLKTADSVRAARLIPDRLMKSLFSDPEFVNARSKSPAN